MTLPLCNVLIRSKQLPDKHVDLSVSVAKKSALNTSLFDIKETVRTLFIDRQTDRQRQRHRKGQPETDRETGTEEET